MPSQLLTAKRESYRAQRAASEGAGIMLVMGFGGFNATFECAEKLLVVIGNRGFRQADEIPLYHIPIEEMHSVTQKLTQKYSVALVEYAMTKNGGHFVMFARLNPVAPTKAETVSTDINDY